MKNTITNFALVLAAFVAVNLLMSFAKPIAAPDEPKQYIVIKDQVGRGGSEQFEKAINQKLAEGWHLQGGVCYFEGRYNQAMAK